MWLKADPSPTSTTDNAPGNPPGDPEDEDYEAIRERFYAEGWDEGRKRRRRGGPDRTVFREWYGEKIEAEAKAKAEQGKAEATPQPEQAQERAQMQQAMPDQPKPQAAKPQPTVESKRAKKATVGPAEPQRLMTAEHAIVPPPTVERQAAPEPQTREGAVPPFAKRESQPAAQEHREVSAPELTRDLGTQGESTVSDTDNESPAKDAAAESEPLIRIAMPAEHVALLTLNTPKIRNALTADMRLALRGALKALAANDQVHALVITGADGNFCAGGDVRTMGETDPHKIRQRMTEVAETALAVASFPKPVIAAVAGHAAGAGVSLACLADIIVVDESTRFTFSFLRLALGPDWGLSWSLPRRVGATKARGLILSRGVIDAREAQQIGLADHHASEGETQIAAIEIAKKLCNGPREATAAVKTMLSDLDGLRAALNAELQMQLERFPSWEHQEGATAFKEKRAADYTKRQP